MISTLLNASSQTAFYWTNFLETTVIVTCVCVVAPITIVWLVTKARTKKMDRKMDILMQAVNNGQEVDPALLVNAEGKKYRLKKNILNRLLVGIIATLSGLMIMFVPYLLNSSWEEAGASDLVIVPIIIQAVGVGFLVSYFVGRKFLAKEIEQEEAELLKQN